MSDNNPIESSASSPAVLVVTRPDGDTRIRAEGGVRVFHMDMPNALGKTPLGGQDREFVELWARCWVSRVDALPEDSVIRQEVEAECDFRLNIVGSDLERVKEQLAIGSASETTALTL